MNRDDESMVKEINEILKEELIIDRIKNLNDFLLIHLSYYLRCKYFHANKVIPIIACKDDKEFYRIQKCINLLEPFLQDYLNKN